MRVETVCFCLRCLVWGQAELHLLLSHVYTGAIPQPTPPNPPITLIHNPIVTQNVTSGHAHIRCTHVLEVLTCLEDTRRPGKPSAGLGSESLCVAAMMILTVSSCRLFIGPPLSGRAPVPRPGCLTGHWGLWGSGKPRGALGRLRPRRTSSTTPEGSGGGDHSVGLTEGSDVVSERKQDV